MQIVFSSGHVTLTREKGDPRFYGVQHAKGEHGLFRYLARELNATGFDVIKKRAQKDGHMIGDEYQPYIRTRTARQDRTHIMIYSGFYQLRGANEDWNKGEVSLILIHDSFSRGQDTESMIRTLCHKAPRATAGNCNG